MTASSHLPTARLSLLALALAAAFAPAWAADEAKPDAKPATEAKAAEAEAPAGPVSEGSASIGLGVRSGDRNDRALFDQYNGLRPGENAWGRFSADYYTRNDELGTSMQFEAVDLFTDNRELAAKWKRQGDWKTSVEYRELTRRAPFTVNSAMNGAGTTSPTVIPLLGGNGSEFDLKTKRSALGAAFSKVLSREWQLDASFKTEEKEGARLFGVGMACPSVIAPGCGGPTGVQVGSGVLLVPEPINSTHTQADARATFASGALRLSGGYYGSFYRNSNGSMTPQVPAALNNPIGESFPLAPGLQAILGQAVALPPDNQAHQIDLAGTYGFTPTTLVNFKLARSLATQTNSFAGMGLTGAPAGRGDLDGKLTTTLAQVGFTARPLDKLSVNGNIRYEDRSDSTPLALYNTEGTATYTNRHIPLTRTSGKLEGNYQFTSDWRGTLAADILNTDRGAFTASSAIAGVTAIRQKTDDTGVRAELRKRMAEDLSGAISIESRSRNGSNWLRDNGGLGVTEVTDPASPGSGLADGIFSPTLADRKRDKVKLTADWQPMEELSLQFVAEGGRDRYDTPQSNYGLRKTSMNQFSVDWNYALSSSWNLNGYLSTGRQELDQARPGATLMAYDNRSATFGFGFTGRLADWDIGGTLSFINDRNAYKQTLDATADAGSAALLAATGGLPDIRFRQTTFKMFGKYALDKKSGIKLEVGYQQSDWNDWAWGYNGTPFVYSDGTTVNAQTRQNVGYVSVSYVRRWQ